MRARVGLLVVVLGCGRLDFDPLAHGDASGGDAQTGDGAPCTFGPWGTPVLFPELGPAADDLAGPALTPDELTIYFASAATGIIDIYVAQRGAKTDAFLTPVLVSAIDDNTARDRDPALAAGGAHLYFTSDRLSPANDSMFTTVGSGATFAAPTLVSEIGPAVLGPWVSDDELELFFTDGSNDTEHADRTDAGLPWTDITNVPELGVGGYPSVSSDGTTIYLEHFVDPNTVIYTATRTMRGGTFTTPQPIPEIDSPFLDCGDPWISADDRTLYFSGELTASAGHQIYASTRSCQ